MSEQEQMPYIVMPSASDRPAAVILADGGYPCGQVASGILAGADKVVCCDGAAESFVGKGGEPYAIVGDCDSLPDEFRERYAAIIHPDADQETNDLTKAVHFCLGRGLAEIVILGATGKREDHTVGNIGLLPGYAALEGLRSVRMVTDYGVFDPIAVTTRFESFPGQQASILCLDPAVRITTYDLLYPLYEAHLEAWWRGTLNQSLGGSFGIGTSGEAIIFRLFKRPEE